MVIGDGTSRSAAHRCWWPSDRWLNLLTGTTTNVPPELKVPTSFCQWRHYGHQRNGSHHHQVQRPDIGKTGAVFVTARVPAGSLSTAQWAPVQRNAKRASANTTSTARTFVLMQLTPSGWQAVVNGQLIPYATGVLGDQLAAQTILNGTDTTNLKGAEFCLGYGTSAAEMNATGRMRTVATIPDPNATGTTALSCVTSPCSSRKGGACWGTA